MNVGGQACKFVDLLEADTGVPRDCLPAAMDDRLAGERKTEDNLVVVVVVVVIVVVALNITYRSE